jgi:hypothetical protein
MRISDKLLNCVGFISHDTPQVKYGATGFVAGIAAERGGGYYLHLVTAKHVAEMVEHGSFLLGMNLKSGSKIFLRMGEIKWWYHPTEADSVDCAVTIFAPASAEEYDTQFIGENTFATDEQIQRYGIGPGDEIAVIGLFTRFSGEAKHFPIVRSGNIAMMPTERIPINGFGDMEAYLAEGRSIGGLSGSPVFARSTINLPLNMGGDRIMFSGLGQWHFIGIMHGHWELPLDFKSTEKAEAVNMGVSIITPAKKILEVLNHPELVQMRKEYDEKRIADNSPRADSALGKKAEQDTQPFTKEDFETALKKVTRRQG